MFANLKISEFVEIKPKVNIPKGKDVPFVQMRDITPGRRYVYSSCSKEYSGGGSKFQAGDVLFARITPCLENGKIAQFKAPEDTQAFGSTEFFVFRSIKGLSDPGFVYYLMSSDFVRLPAIKSMIGASGRQRADINVISNTEVRVPELRVQKKIASILSAYDDLIENNIRRIKILEEMAQLIYREWFVKFRFPGHENVRMVESEFGLIPEGWEVKPVGEVFDTLGGGTPSTKNPQYWENGTITWFSPSDLTSAGTMFISDSAKKITQKGLEKSSAKMFPAYSVMMTSRATIGATAINTVPACTNQGFIVCIPNEIASTYQIYYWILTNKERIETIASGATYKEINRTEFRSFSYVIADLETRKRFESLIEPLAKQIENLTKKNLVLRRTRDLFLPKLISGELDVEDLDIAVGGD